MPDRYKQNKFDRTVFYISDGTGITAETFGHSVLSQFQTLKFRQLRLPFVDSQLKAQEAILKINAAAASDGAAPIVFSTLVDAQINTQVRESVNAKYMDLFSAFIEPLEHEFGVKSSHAVGLSHASANTEAYKDRIEAINFSLAHDDGQTNKGLEGSDVILVGVSRSGKTPTSLYLAMQHGLKAANYPLIPEDFERDQLPSGLTAHRGKLFGLTIAPERLSEIRNERRPNSRYAALDNCRYEVDAAERMMRREGIRWLSSTTKSIEEIATTILQELKLERPGY